jgi:hypothetical protein
LSALAATVESFEGDKATAMRVRRHSGNDKSALGIWHLAFGSETSLCGTPSPAAFDFDGVPLDPNVDWGKRRNQI